MDTNTLDNHLAKKDLKQVFAAIRNAGYKNSILYQKGYIVAKKTNLVKVRVVLDEYGNPLVTLMYPQGRDILIGIFIFLVFAILGGFLLLGFIVYILYRATTFLVSMSKCREFKAEIEQII